MVGNVAVKTCILSAMPPSHALALQRRGTRSELGRIHKSILFQCQELLSFLTIFVHTSQASLLFLCAALGLLQRSQLRSPCFRHAVWMHARGLWVWCRLPHSIRLESHLRSVAKFNRRYLSSEWWVYAYCFSQTFWFGLKKKYSWRIKIEFAWLFIFCEKTTKVNHIPQVKPLATFAFCFIVCLQRANIKKFFIEVVPLISTSVSFIYFFEFLGSQLQTLFRKVPMKNIWQRRP